MKGSSPVDHRFRGISRSVVLCRIGLDAPQTVHGAELNFYYFSSNDILFHEMFRHETMGQSASLP